MKFLLLDDAKQKSPSRERMGSLVGVGGLIVDAEKLRDLEKQLQCISESFGFPRGEMFKWSPGKSDWMRKNLTGEDRNEFFRVVLDCCNKSNCKAIVAICDETKRMATAQANDHEVDALLLALERFHNHIKAETGLVMVAKPAGGQRDANKMLAECVEHKQSGTDFVNFERFAQNPVIVPTKNSRVLQAADLIVSTTTAMCAGNVSFAKDLFKSYVKPMLISDWRGLKGNTGLKLHPFILYKNIYFWVLDEKFWAKGSTGFSLPDAGCPYSIESNTY